MATAIPSTSTSRIHRCPACGWRITTPPPPNCPVCSFPFGDERVTGADVTPYARAYARGEPGWRRMSEWVWFSGRERLKHLALMRASAASRRFAHLNLVLVAVGLALIDTTRTGWRWVTGLPESEPTGSATPVGSGWLHVAAAPRPLSPGRPQADFIDLWWNPVQTGTVIIVAVILGFLAGWLVLGLIRAGVTRAHQPPYRSEQRMTAALHYGTAWGILLFAAAVVTGLRPISFVGTMARWPWYPPDNGFVLSAAVIAAFGLAMGWFWLIRVGATAPAKTRGAVVGFFVLGAPLVVIAAAAAWWFGVGRLYEPLFVLLDIEF